MAIAAPWLVLRLRFFRRKWVALTLARTPAGEQLLALRALANRPLAKLAAINADPVGRVATRRRRGDQRPCRRSNCEPEASPAAAPSRNSRFRAVMCV